MSYILEFFDFARGARALGVRQFILITAVGAGGPGFYLKTKGVIERDVTDLRFDRLDLIRPGFLEGGRNEQRPLEAIGSRLFSVLAQFFRAASSASGRSRQKRSRRP